MILPYDTSMSYWMMAVPRFEWQPEPQAAAADSALPDAASGDAALAAAGADPAGCAGDEPALPRLRLVITGVNWVAVPFWSPRENPSWNVMADAARDEDRQRIETRDGAARRSPEDGQPEAGHGKGRT